MKVLGFTITRDRVKETRRDELDHLIELFRSWSSQMHKEVKIAENAGQGHEASRLRAAANAYRASADEVALVANKRNLQ